MTIIHMIMIIMNSVIMKAFNIIMDIVIDIHWTRTQEPCDASVVCSSALWWPEEVFVVVV